MMATVPHVTSGLGLRKFQADGFLLTQVYQIIVIEKKLGVGGIGSVPLGTPRFCLLTHNADLSVLTALHWQFVQYSAIQHNHEVLYVVERASRYDSL